MNSPFFQSCWRTVPGRYSCSVLLEPSGTTWWWPHNRWPALPSWCMGQTWSTSQSGRRWWRGPRVDANRKSRIRSTWGIVWSVQMWESTKKISPNKNKLLQNLFRKPTSKSRFVNLVTYNFSRYDLKHWWELMRNHGLQKPLCGHWFL